MLFHFPHRQLPFHALPLNQSLKQNFLFYLSIYHLYFPVSFLPFLYSFSLLPINIQYLISYSNNIFFLSFLFILPFPFNFILFAFIFNSGPLSLAPQYPLSFAPFGCPYSVFSSFIYYVFPLFHFHSFHFLLLLHVTVLFCISYLCFSFPRP